jgi:sulfoxide reductase heme-binding subunit YedZ
MAVLHAAVGLNVHLRGKPWLYFVDQHHRVRHDLFGFGNDTGTLAALFFLLLLAISNDFSLRRLGAQKWKSLQRWTYAAVALTVAHAAAYQQVEKRQAAYQAALWGAALVMAAFQIAGYWTRRNSPGQPRM